jgi:N-hydroxyarylamine O-acetyltransferase
MSDDPNIDAYFERIGFSGSIAPTLQTLEALHALHPAAIPFENLDPLMGVPIRLELRNLEQKLLFEKRGGYCFEHNLLFKAMLEDLGFPVRPLAARVLWNHPPGEDRPISHMVMLADVNGTEYLADVAFGAVTLTAPLRLRADTEQETTHNTFRLSGGDPTWQLDVKIRDEWRPMYSFEEVERTLEDYIAYNDLTAGDTNFVDNVIAARTDKTRRATLRNSLLKLQPVGGEIEQRTLSGIAEVKDALVNIFGISLPPADKLDPAIERVLAGAAA